ncbi:hypothetical protein PY365_08000 [Roseiarcaceae bacterium H3SJ34-1]|uniref:hypothetical protein n=1 Tax=Terripilifer ovatus TaxID=3032367 RepID=UPI003AB99BF5|nr:hypothetical protein [Roseiarcaceae bacterium H3SJ34-1]
MRFAAFGAQLRISLINILTFLDKSLRSLPYQSGGFDMDMWEPVFSQAQVARAAGLESTQRMRLWFNRNQLNFTECEPASKLALRLSARMALHVAIMNAATTQWVPPVVANSAATVFLQAGSTDLQTGAIRLPGELFAEPWTVLAIPQLGKPRILHLPDESGLIAITGHEYAMNGFTLIVLDRIYREVVARLQEFSNERPFRRQPSGDVARLADVKQPFKRG